MAGPKFETPQADLKDRAETSRAENFRAYKAEFSDKCDSLAPTNSGG